MREANMSDYTRDIGREFWYDFDNQTLWNRTDEVNDALPLSEILPAIKLTLCSVPARYSQDKACRLILLADRLQMVVE